MSMDTYKLRVMHCPLCEHQASHRAVSAFPAIPCPKCKGIPLGQYVDGVTHLDLLAKQAEYTSVTIRS